MRLLMEGRNSRKHDAVDSTGCNSSMPYIRALIADILRVLTHFSTLERHAPEAEILELSGLQNRTSEAMRLLQPA